MLALQVCAGPFLPQFPFCLPQLRAEHQNEGGPSLWSRESGGQVSRAPTAQGPGEPDNRVVRFKSWGGVGLSSCLVLRTQHIVAASCFSGTHSLFPQPGGEVKPSSSVSGPRKNVVVGGGFGGFPLGSHVVSRCDTGPRSWAFQIHDLDTTSGYLSLHPSSTWENRGRRDGWVWIIEDSHADFKSGWGCGQVLALLRVPAWAAPI